METNKVAPVLRVVARKRRPNPVAAKKSRSALPLLRVVAKKRRPKAKAELADITKEEVPSTITEELIVSDQDSMSDEDIIKQRLAMAVDTIAAMRQQGKIRIPKT